MALGVLLAVGLTEENIHSERIFSLRCYIPDEAFLLAVHIDAYRIFKGGYMSQTSISHGCTLFVSVVHPILLDDHCNLSYCVLFFCNIVSYWIPCGVNMFRLIKSIMIRSPPFLGRSLSILSRSGHTFGSLQVTLFT